MHWSRVERVDRLIAGVWIVVGVVVLVADTQVPHVTISDPLGPAFLPNALALALIAMGLVLFRRRSALPEDDTGESAAGGDLIADVDEDAATGKDLAGSGRQLAVGTIIVIAYLALLPVIHFIPATVLATSSFMFLGGTRSWRVLTLYPVGLSVALYYIFGQALMVMLP